MKALFTYAADVPWSRVIADHRRGLVPVGIVLAINVIVLVGIVMPMRQSVATGTEQAARAAEARNAAIAELRDAEATRDGQAQATKDLDRFYIDVLPSNFAAARRMTQLKLAQMARSHNVTFERGATTPEVLPESTLERLRVNCELSGDWDDIRELIYEIETGPDFIVIENVELSEGQGGDTPLALTLELSTYYRVLDNVR